jgi:hypothetical protein
VNQIEGIAFKILILSPDYRIFGGKFRLALGIVGALLTTWRGLHPFRRIILCSTMLNPEIDKNSTDLGV